MLNVLVRGPLLSKSGYGEHCRQVLKYLMSKQNLNVSCQVLPWGITPWYMNHDDLDGLVGKIIKMSMDDINKKFDVSVQVQLPNEWDTSLANKNIGVSSFDEFSNIKLNNYFINEKSTSYSFSFFRITIVC